MNLPRGPERTMGELAVARVFPLPRADRNAGSTLVSERRGSPAASVRIGRRAKRSVKEVCVHSKPCFSTNPPERGGSSLGTALLDWQCGVSRQHSQSLEHGSIP